MVNNILVIDKHRFDLVSDRSASMIQMMDFVILTTDEVFYIMKNRLSYQDIDKVYPLDFHNV